jgi:predicted cupin superfamily sugar epimerase
MRPTVAELTRVLGLEPHPEGGFYRETYRSAEVVETPRGRRAACTAILFLVTDKAVSRLHRLESDELWVFQGGLPLELVLLEPEGEPRRIVLGDPAEPERLEAGGKLVPQALAPAGCWQGARLAGGIHLPADRAWSLASCVVTPGFEFEDFEMGDRETLLAACPEHGELIRALT